MPRRKPQAPLFPVRWITEIVQCPTCGPSPVQRMDDDDVAAGDPRCPICDQIGAVARQGES